MDKKVLLGMTAAELKQVAQQLGMPAFTGGQIAKWLYEKNVMSIDEMTNISKQNRERLAEEYCVGAMAPIDCQRSVDGTVKYLFPVRTANASPLTSHPSLLTSHLSPLKNRLPGRLRPPLRRRPAGGRQFPVWPLVPLRSVASAPGRDPSGTAHPAPPGRCPHLSAPRGRQDTRRERQAGQHRQPPGVEACCRRLYSTGEQPICRENRREK